MPRTRVCRDRAQRQPVDGAHRACQHQQRRSERPGADRPDDQPDDGRHCGAADGGGGDLRPTVCVAPPMPTRSAVVKVSSGNTGAAASPSTIIPATATAPGPGSAISSAPNGTQATARASTRDAPARSATGPRKARPANIIAQWADTATPATVTGRPRPDVRNTYPQMPAADSIPVSTAVNASPARITVRPGDGRLRSDGHAPEPGRWRRSKRPQPRLRRLERSRARRPARGCSSAWTATACPEWNRVARRSSK